MGASELRLGGASETRYTGASEWLMRGASERLLRGASEWRSPAPASASTRGASELAYAGASELLMRGASERLSAARASGWEAALATGLDAYAALQPSRRRCLPAGEPMRRRSAPAPTSFPPPVIRPNADEGKGLMATGYFSLVLHAHLPFVRHPEDPTVMEEQWLYEAITGTYLPLLQMFEGLVADDVPFRCTVSLSAPLITMLTDDLLKERYAAHLDKLIELADKEVDRTRPSRTTSGWRRCTATASASLRHTWRCHDGDLVRGVPPAAGGRAPRGHHLDGDARLLPADGSQLGRLPRPGPRRGRSLRAALRPPPARHVARRVRLRARASTSCCARRHPLLLRRHARHPVRRPPPGLRRLRAGLLPERRRRVRARHRVVASRSGAPRRATRATRTTATSTATSASTCRSTTSARTSTPRGTGCTPASSTTRSPTTSCTTSGSTTPTSRAARPASTPRTSAATASSRSSTCAASMDRPPIIVSPYDAELFGHWWYEGPIFLDDLFRQLHYDQNDGRDDHAGRLPRALPDQPGRDAVRVVVGRQGLRRLLAERDATPGSTATCTSPPSAWSSSRAASRTPTPLTRARAQPGGARADAGADQRLGLHHDDRHDGALRHPAHRTSTSCGSRGSTTSSTAAHGERAAGSPTSRRGTTSSRDLDYRIYATLTGARATAPAVPAQGPVRRVGVRAVRQDRRPGRRRRRAAKALRALGIDVRVVMPLYAGMPWSELEVLDGVARGADVVRHGARRACASAGCPRSEVPVYFLEYNRYFDRPYLYGPPGRGLPRQPRALHVPVARRAGALQGARVRSPTSFTRNDWQTALVPVYLNTVEWAQPLHGSAERLHDPQPGLSGRASTAARMFITGLGREHYNPASSSTSAR